MKGDGNMGDVQQSQSSSITIGLDSNQKNFSHGEEFISDGVNLVGEGPDLLARAPTDFG